MHPSPGLNVLVGWQEQGPLEDARGVGGGGEECGAADDVGTAGWSVGARGVVGGQGRGLGDGAGGCGERLGTRAQGRGNGAWVGLAGKAPGPAAGLKSGREGHGVERGGRRGVV